MRGGEKDEDEKYFSLEFRLKSLPTAGRERFLAVNFFPELWKLALGVKKLPWVSRFELLCANFFGQRVSSSTRKIDLDIRFVKTVG